MKPSLFQSLWAISSGSKGTLRKLSFTCFWFGFSPLKPRLWPKYLNYKTEGSHGSPPWGPLMGPLVLEAAIFSSAFIKPGAPWGPRSMIYKSYVYTYLSFLLCMFFWCLLVFFLYFLNLATIEVSYTANLLFTSKINLIQTHHFWDLRSGLLVKTSL